MDGVLFSRSSVKTGGGGRHLARPLLALGGRPKEQQHTSSASASSGHEHLSGSVGESREQREQQPPPQQQQRVTYDHGGCHHNTSPWRMSFEGRLPVLVVSCLNDALCQIPALRSAPVGTCMIAVIAAVSHGQPANDRSQNPTPGIEHPPLVLQPPTDVLDSATESVKKGTILCEQINGISNTSATARWGVWRCNYPWRSSVSRSERCRARLGILCKFPGAVIECPLAGDAFELKEVNIDDALGEVVGTRERISCTQMCWTLPSRGFEALQDVQTHLFLGVSALAREMANDSSCTREGLASAEKLARTFANEGRTYVVAPDVTGIYFFLTATVGFKDKSTVRVTVARFEGKGGSYGIQQCLRLEDYDNIEAALPQGSAGTGKPICTTAKKRRYLAMPVTYDTLLNEATTARRSADPGKGNSMKWKMWRWRRHSRYMSASTRIVPGLGEDAEYIHAENTHNENEMHPHSMSDQKRQRLGRLEADEYGVTSWNTNEVPAAPKALTTSGLVPDTEDNANVPEVCVHEENGTTSEIEPVGLGQCLKTKRSDGIFLPDGAPQTTKAPDTPCLHAVQTASRGLVMTWASNRGIAREILANACREEESGHDSTSACDREDCEGSSCSGARHVACALLAKALFSGAGLGADGHAGRHQQLCETQTSILLDAWYEEFWIAAASFGRVQSILSQHSLLLLDCMLRISDVREGFLQRGLLRRLADGLTVSVEANWLRLGEVSIGEPAVAYRSPSVAEDSSRVAFTHPDSASATRPTTEADGVEGVVVGNVGASPCTPCKCTAAPKSGRINVALKQDGGCHDPEQWNTILLWLLTSAENGLMREAKGANGKGEGESGGDGAETDAGSCKTASDGEFVPVESDFATNRDKSAIADLHNLKSNILNASDTFAGEESTAQGKPVGGGGGKGNARERATPPLLRLDVLGRGHDLQEWSSPPSSRRGATATLSAASTRASTHLPTFRSARGATSRASARRHTGGCNGGGGTERTGRTTQRSSCCCSPLPPTGGSLSPPQSPDDRESSLASGPPPPDCNDNATTDANSRASTSSNPFPGEADSIAETILAANRLSSGSEGTHGKVPRDSQQSTAAKDASHGDSPPTGMCTCDVSEGTADEIARSAEAERVVAGSANNHCSGKRAVPLLHLARLPTSTMTTTVEDPISENSACAMKGGQFETSNSIPPAESVISTGVDCDPIVLESAVSPTVNPRRNSSQLPDQVERQVPAECETDPRGVTDGVVVTEDCTVRDVVEFPPTTWPLPFGGRMSGVRERCDGEERTAVALVVSIACAPTPSPQRRTSRKPIGGVWCQLVATAELVISLLALGYPLADDKGTEAAIAASLTVFSCIGVRSRMESFAASFAPAPDRLAPGVTMSTTSTDESEGRADQTLDGNSSAENFSAETLFRESTWLKELERVDLTLLLRGIQAHPAYRMNSSPPKSCASWLNQAASHASIVSANEPCYHRQRVSMISRLSLERAWLTRLLVRRMFATCQLDLNLRSRISADAVVQVLDFCAETLKELFLNVHCHVPRNPDDDNSATNKFRATLASELTIDPSMLLFAAPTAVELATLLKGAIWFPSMWGDDMSWAVATIQSRALSEVGHVGIIPALITLVDRLTATLTADKGTPSQGTAVHDALKYLERRGEQDDGRGECKSWRKLPTARVLMRMLGGSRAVVDELLVRVLESVEAFLSRCATLLNAYRSAPLPSPLSRRQAAASLIEAATSGGDRLASAGERNSERIGPGDTSRRQAARQPDILRDISLEQEFPSDVFETVYQMLTVVSSLFQPKGSVLTILRTSQLSSHFDGIFKRNEAVPHKNPYEYTGQIGHAVVASTLRLSTVFFSLWAESGRTCCIFRPEKYAAPLFEGFVRHLGAVSDPGTGGETTSNQGMSDETRTRRTARDTEQSKIQEPGNMLLCQRYLGALVALTAIPDTRVRQVMHEHRVAQFLICEVLAAGHTTTSPRTSATVSSPRQRLVAPATTIHGSVSERGKTVGVMDRGPISGSPVIKPMEVSAAPDATTAPIKRSEQTRGSDCSASNGRDRSKCASSQRGVALVKPDTAPYRVTLGVGRKYSFGNAKRCDSGGPGRAGPRGQGAGSMIAEGDRIDGLVFVRTGGRPRWFPGRVVKVNQDGTMHICYDDGDEETRKDRACIRSERKRARPPRSGAGSVAAKESNRGPPVTRKGGDKGVPMCEENSSSRTVGKLEDAVEMSEQNDGEPNVSESEHVESIGNAESAVHRASSSRICSITGAEGTEAVVQNVVVPETVEIRCDDLKDDNGNNLYDRQDGDNHDKNHSEEGDEEDMYFEIPRVIAGVEPATNWVELRGFPTSTVPRIDLQSPFFSTTTMRSTQLGPGSSLSTPTTGRSANRLRGRGGLRSDGVLQVPSASGSITRSRRPSLITGRMSGRSPLSISYRGSSSALLSSMSPSARSVSVSGSTSGKEESCSVTVAQRTTDDEESEGGEACEETNGASGRSHGTRQDGTVPMHEGAQETEGGVAATTGSSANASSPMDRTALKEGPLCLNERQNINRSRLSVVSACVDTTIQEGAVALLLNLSATAGDDCDLAAKGDIYHTVVPASRLDDRPQEGGGQDLEADGMMFLRTFFDDPENVHMVSGLGTRWRGHSIPATSIAEKSAILAKLTCAALFDERSYNLNSDHIETGMFGGVIMSRSPLPLEVSSRREKRASRGTGTGHNIADEASPFEVRSDQDVALKVIEADSFDHAIGPNVYSEVLALRALADVVGVCRLYDFGLTSTSYVLVLEGCLRSLKSWRLGREGLDNDDDTASAMVAKSPSSDLDVLLYLLIFKQIATAVAAMAAHGVIHCDLKCDNVLVRGPSRCGGCSEVGPVVRDGGELGTRVPSVCVADFGEAVVGYPKPTPPNIPLLAQEACVVDNGEDEPKFEFCVRRARGTERIQSPEMLLYAGGRGGSNSGCSQLNGPGSVDGEVCSRVRGGAKNAISTATDVWSLGCLLYELLSGTLLFELPLWSEFFVLLTMGESRLPQATRDTRQVRGKHEAQEAHAAHDGHAEQWNTSSGTSKATMKQQPTPLPAASSMEPLAALGSAETLRNLLESMLIRDPISRPSASDVVVGTGKAISTVVEMLASVACSGNMVDGVCLRAEVAPRAPKERKSGETRSSTEYKRSLPFDSKKATRSTVSNETPSVGWNTSANEDSSDNADLAWSIQPCDAAGVEREVAIIRSIKLGCEGYVSRLAAGAFLVTLQRSRTGSNRVGCSGKNYRDDMRNYARFGRLHESPRKVGVNAPRGPKSIRSDTLLCTVGDTLGWLSEGVEGAVSLRSFLPALGITHVVCVMTGREDGNGQESSGGYTESSTPAPIQSMEGFGPRLMHVYLPGDWSNDNASTRHCHKRASGMDEVVGDVMAFATRSRALFVGEDEDGGAAGAMATAWAMNRTGKSAYEVMLEFRQSCNGFWVEPSVLRAVLG